MTSSLEIAIEPDIECENRIAFVRRDNYLFPKLAAVELLWDDRNRRQVLVFSALAIILISLGDWWTEPYVSLGFLYLFPVMLAAAHAPRWFAVLLGLGCAGLVEIFSSLPKSFVRLCFEMMALVGCGLFVGELVRNRRLSIQAQAKLNALVEASPAAIVTVDEYGSIELANRAAFDLLAPRYSRLIGNPISAFLPELHHAIRWNETPQFRASLQCHGHRGNDESFDASVWFSTYKEGAKPKLAAIIIDITREEERAARTAKMSSSLADAPTEDPRPVLTDREMIVLRLVVQGLANKVIAREIEISESAVKNTIQQLFGKTGVRSRSQLVRVALEQYGKIR